MKTYQKDKTKAVKDFYTLLAKARQLVSKISKGREIELQANGVTFVMIDPFDDNGFMSDVVKVENGNIHLENGSEVNVNDVTNVTDLIGLLETIDE